MLSPMEFAAACAAMLLHNMHWSDIMAAVEGSILCDVIECSSIASDTYTCRASVMRNKFEKINKKLH